MSGTYRSQITTLGFHASRLYGLSDDDESDERIVAMIKAGWLVKTDEPDNVHGGEMPREDGADRYAHTQQGPFVEGDSIAASASPSTTPSPDTEGRGAKGFLEGPSRPPVLVSLEQLGMTQEEWDANSVRLPSRAERESIKRGIEDSHTGRVTAWQAADHPTDE